jgi:DNA-binding NarL/FixJ family response regulator
MRVLLVEDDEHKRRGIIAALRICDPQTEVIVAESLYTGIQSIDDVPFDLVVLDMAIPSHPPVPGEGSPVSFNTGGLDVLLELDSRGRSDRCIVITQFPEIEVSRVFYPVDVASEAIEKELGYTVIDCIAYSGHDGDWLDKFSNLLVKNGYSRS